MYNPDCDSPTEAREGVDIVPPLGHEATFITNVVRSQLSSESMRSQIAPEKPSSPGTTPPAIDSTKPRRKSRSLDCDQCDKSFTDPSNKQRHIKTIHDHSTDSACEKCGHTFNRSDNKNTHKKR